ncbi:TonB family protein [Sporomusa aerivorans]|uniref:TonB family protein n=1 Tax=Sporomusa aerivorans TaxID=204936 RepID=UPI00352A0131
MAKCYSWRRAFLFSVLVHLSVALCFGLFFTGYVQHHPEAEYVIDLDMLIDSAQGSGRAGGDSLPDTRPAEPQALTADPAPVSADSLALPAAAPVSAPVSSSTTAVAGAVGSRAGEGQAGSGGGTGAGAGHGEGAGDGQGSGSSGVVGTGSSPFDFVGFANAVDANKQYPYMAVKRNIQGAVTVAVTLDANGNLVSAGAVSSGSSLLEQAALQAIRAACPYPNAARAAVSFTTTVHFVLN